MGNLGEEDTCRRQRRRHSVQMIEQATLYSRKQYTREQASKERTVQYGHHMHHLPPLPPREEGRLRGMFRARPY
jgi:hypothetical protein